MTAPLLAYDDVLDAADLERLCSIANSSQESHHDDPTVWFRHDQDPRCFNERIVEALRPWSPQEARGGEWWFHMQPTDADLALHFEKDDALARTEGIFRQPLRACILYLTECGGPTLFTEQRYLSPTRVDPPEPSTYALIHPPPNRLVSFDARLYHGVLREESTPALRQSFLINWWREPPIPPDCITSIGPVSSARIPAGSRPLGAHQTTGQRLDFRPFRA